MRPLIGISCSYDWTDRRFFLPEAYVEAVIQEGGIPVILPGSPGLKSAEAFFGAIKGLLLSGGGDVDPRHFHEEPMPGLGEITPERDRFELMMVRSALRKKLPILGICRGLQVLNVAAGGTLIQHIPAAVKKPLKHSQDAPRWHATHCVYLEKPSRLADIVNRTDFLVNSFHHQAVKEPAPGFVVSARSGDGVIEAIESVQHPFALGVQWHPEGMAAKDDQARLLFRAFIQAAAKVKRKAGTKIKKK